MSQVDKDFIQMCSCGYGCDLQTLGEAYTNVQLHYDAFFTIDTAVARLNALGDMVVEKGLHTTIREAMGVEWCAEEDRKEQEYWAMQKALDEDREKLGALGMLEDDEGDFLCGKTCNPDTPEECESCQ